MDEKEIAALMQYVNEHHDEIFAAAVHQPQAHARHPLTKKRMAMRLVLFVGIVVIYNGVAYLSHYDGVLKGMEFLGAAVTDKLIFGELV